MRTYTSWLTFALILICTPLTADWLVTRDGLRIETRGEWSAEAERVVFTDLNGQLSALSLSEIDLEASRQATEEALRPQTPSDAEASEAESGGSVMTITDADVGKASADDTRSAAKKDADKVVLYATSWCGWCRKTRSLLTELGLPFVEKDIEKDPVGYREYVAKVGSGAGVPVLDYKGQIVRGYGEAAIRGWAEDRERESAEK